MKLFNDSFIIKLLRLFKSKEIECAVDTEYNNLKSKLEPKINIKKAIKEMLIETFFDYTFLRHEEAHRFFYIRNPYGSHGDATFCYCLERKPENEKVIKATEKVLEELESLEKELEQLESDIRAWKY